jgi:AAHS family benzoate transporter-like MFS transporter
VHHGHRTLLRLLSLALCFEGYGRALMVVTLPYVGTDLGATPAELSYALALISVGSLGVLVLGPLADRFGRRRLLLASIGLFSLLGVGTASATTVSSLIAWQAAARMFQEGALFAAAVIIAEEVPAQSRAAAQGIVGMINSMGAGIGALLLATITLWPGGWRGLCFVSLVPLTFLPFLRRTLPESRRWLERDRGVRQALPAVYRERLLAAGVVVFLAMSYDVAGFAFSSYLPIDAYGWSPAAVSAMLVIAGGVGLPGWWLGGWLADRRGRRGAAAIFFLGLTAAQLSFYLLGPRALWPAFAAMVFCQGGKITVLRSWATELFPTNFRGSASGWLAAAGTLGGIAGLGLAGLLEPVLGGVGRALAVISAAGVLATAVALRWLPETMGLELEASAPEVA